ncbi:hypothetical protein [Marinilabilia salmonicolor]|uniref:hypothetical protein n=1 Tax=Marinilabilia salmonicolor TaxID=989 RepID=UPI00046A65F6|nr:hypothetical protein [Marinilabilia salmonicolor]
MKIEIIKGKEIEFIEQINLLKNLTNNEPHIQRLIDAISYDPNKADRLKHDDILPDIQFVKNIFERIDNRKKFNTKDAGKNYEFFTRGDFFKFIQTEHLSQIIGLKILWELLQNMHISNKRIRNKTELAFLSLEIAEEYENLFQKNMDEYLNSLEIRKSLLPDFPIEQVINSEYFYNLPFYINIEDHLVQISDEIPNTAENIEDILDNDTPLFINHDGRILKICKSTFGFTIETTSELGCLESISVKNLKFYYGLYIPNQTESGFINSNYPPSGLKLYRVSEIEQVPESPGFLQCC